MNTVFSECRKAQTFPRVRLKTPMTVNDQLSNVQIASHRVFQSEKPVRKFRW